MVPPQAFGNFLRRSCPTSCFHACRFIGGNKEFPCRRGKDTIHSSPSTATSATCYRAHSESAMSSPASLLTSALPERIAKSVSPPTITSFCNVLRVQRRDQRLPTTHLHRAKSPENGIFAQKESPSSGNSHHANCRMRSAGSFAIRIEFRPSCAVIARSD